uniref:Uncharacterized protein n=1 Tax=Alexandrium monilatum TaxID=311494 RepID=A0A7S4SR49_9DINO
MAPAEVAAVAAAAAPAAVAVPAAATAAAEKKTKAARAAPATAAAATPAAAPAVALTATPPVAPVAAHSAAAAAAKAAAALAPTAPAVPKLPGGPLAPPPNTPPVAPAAATPALQKVLATQPRAQDATQPLHELRGPPESCADACRRWEALLDRNPPPTAPPSYWGGIPPGNRLGYPHSLLLPPPCGSSLGHPHSGIPYGAPPGSLPSWPWGAASPYGLPLGSPYHQAVSPLAALSAAATATPDAASRSLWEASRGSGLRASTPPPALPLPPGITEADAMPWKLACPGSGPGPGTSEPPGLAAPAAAASSAVPSKPAAERDAAHAVPPAVRPAGNAAGTYLLRLVNEEAAARKEGAEAGAAILQHLRGGGGPASGSGAGAGAAHGDATAGAELLRQLRPQQEAAPQEKPRWWLDPAPPGLAGLTDAEGTSASALDGIVEASQRPDGSQWVCVNGQWIKASGKYYCSYCRVFGNKLDPHLASANHQKRRAAAIEKEWESWGDKRKQKGWK